MAVPKKRVSKQRQRKRRNALQGRRSDFEHMLEDRRSEAPPPRVPHLGRVPGEGHLRTRRGVTRTYPAGGDHSDADRP